MMEFKNYSEVTTIHSLASFYKKVNKLSEISYFINLWTRCYFLTNNEDEFSKLNCQKIIKDNYYNNDESEEDDFISYE